jgi:hypothetical protein
MTKRHDLSRDNDRCSEFVEALETDLGFELTMVRGIAGRQVRCEHINLTWPELGQLSRLWAAVIHHGHLESIQLESRAMELFHWASNQTGGIETPWRQLSTTEKEDWFDLAAEDIKKENEE